MATCEDCELPAPPFKCGNIQYRNTITKIKILKNGDCFDQNDNYIGKGKLNKDNGTYVVKIFR